MNGARQRGFTLVELMVALVIGLLLLAGVLQILLSNRASFDAQRATAHLQENIRLADFVLGHAIAHAGYRTSLDATEVSIFPASSNAAPAYPSGAYITGSTDSSTGNAVLRMRFQAQGDVRDCLGGSVGTAQSGQVSDFEFYVASTGTLECTKHSGSSATTEPIVENVDRFKVRYGLDTDTTTGVDRYVSTLSGSQASEVRSVRIQLLIHSQDDDPAIDHDIAQQYTFSDGTIFNADDRRARILLDRTIVLRNPKP